MGLGPLTLDPEAMRALGYRIVDLIVERHSTAREDLGQVGPRSALEAIFREPPPEAPGDPVEVLRLVSEHVFRNTIDVRHPRFFAFVPSPSNYVSAVAAALVSGFNAFAGNWLEASGPAQVELVTVDWIRELLGLPVGFGGIFVSGGSAANLAALIAARSHVLGEEIEGGTIYASDQTHSSVARAARAIGVPRDAFVTIPSDTVFRADPAAMRRAIERDRAAGKRPFAIIANAGTTNTSAIDPLAELAALAKEERLWLHVDAAFGAAAGLLDAGRALLAGLGLADSITVDPHKWWFQPYESGVLLAREPRKLRETFYVTAEYLKAIERELEEINYCDYGLQLTRDFKALELWMSLKIFGVAAFREAIAHGCRLAEHAQRRLTAMPGWEVVTPAQLGVLTFRFAAAPGNLDALQDRAVAEVVASGLAFLANTRLAGRTVMRLCTQNPGTTTADVDATLDALDRAVR